MCLLISDLETVFLFSLLCGLNEEVFRFLIMMTDDGVVT